MGLTTYSSIFTIHTSCNYSDTKLVTMKVLSNYKTVNLPLGLQLYKLSAFKEVVENLEKSTNEY